MNALKVWKENQIHTGLKENPTGQYSDIVKLKLVIVSQIAQRFIHSVIQEGHQDSFLSDFIKQKETVTCTVRTVTTPAVRACTVMAAKQTASG